MLINEAIMMTKPIVESNDKGQLPKGVLCRVTYPICNIGERNANNRIYESAVWEKVFEDADLMAKIKARALFGHAEHPEQTQSNLEKTSHVICEMWRDENTIYQKIDVLDTPTGRIVGTLLEAGCNVGMSTRADGDLQECEDDDGAFSRVIPESYGYKTTDFTADPSTFGAIPQNLQHNITQEARRQLKNESLHAGERQFAQMICESFDSLDKDEEVKKLTIKECLESKQITEGSVIKNGDKEDMVVSISESKMTLTINGQSFEADGDGYVAIQGDGTMYLCPESEAGADELPSEMPMVDPDAELPGEEEPEMEVELPDEDAIDALEDELEDELPESVEEPKEKDADPVVEAEEPKEEDADPVVEAEEPKEEDAEPVEEAEEVEDEEEDYVDLQIQEASMRAERDKALELLETQTDLVTDAKAAWKKDRVFEIKILTKKLTEAKKSSAEKVAGLEVVILEHETTISGLGDKLNESTTLVESTNQSTADTTSKLEEKVSVLEAAQVEATQTSDKAIADLSESHAATMTSKIEETKTAVGAEVTSDFVKGFIRIRVMESNLKLSRNSQTLLEECKTLEEVDSLMEEIVDAKRRRSALHTRANEHTIRKPKPVDPETQKIGKLMEGVFEGMGK